MYRWTRRRKASGGWRRPCSSWRKYVVPSASEGSPSQVRRGFLAIFAARNDSRNMKERLTRRGWALIAVCAAIAAVSLFVIFRWFNAAFPEASIEFRYDRKASMPLAESVLARQGLDHRGMKHTAIFDGDGTAKIFLERSVGLTRANSIMRRDVRLWWWRNRWF